MLVIEGTRRGAVYLGHEVARERRSLAELLQGDDVAFGAEQDLVDDSVLSRCAACSSLDRCGAWYVV